MTDSSGAPSDIHPSETIETQLAQADDAAAATEPPAGDAATAEPAAGGADPAAADAPAVCEIPNTNIVDVPVPAPGERITLAVAPGDALRLACSFRDVSGVEEGDTLVMTFPGGGVVVVENFSAWVAAQGASITDCVCGGVNLAEFVVALGLNPAEMLPAAGAQGGAQSSDLEGSGFTPGPGPQLLTGLPYPNILPPTGLGYGLPDPRQGLAAADDDGDPFGDDLGGPLASAPDPLTVTESTQPLALQLQTLSFALTGFGAAASADGGEGCAPPTGPVEFVPDQASGQIFTNDDFGPDGKGTPPLVSFTYTGSTAVDDVNGVLQPDGVTLRITSVDPLRPWYIDVNINTGLATVHLTGTYDHTGDNSDGDVALETFEYTIQDRDGDVSSTQVTVQIVDSVPVAHDDCEVCIVEPGAAGGVTVGGNVMANDDLGADQFLPEGTDLISFTYDNGTQTASVPDGGSTTVTTAIGGTLTVHSDGEWTYTPPASVDNSNGNVHDNFTYTIRDGDGDTSQAVQPICIQDGAAPLAHDNKQCVDEGAPQNVVIIADVSGSMDDDDIDPDTDGKQTRLELEKEALTALVEKYAELGGTVTITLIAFASGAGANQPGGTDTNGALNLGTFTFGSTSDPGYLAAIAAIASLAIGMNGLDTETEYDDALILAQQVLQGQLAGQAEGTENTVYFLSDGQPNPSSNGAGATGWKAFVNANGIEVIAVGMGGDIAGNAGAIAELAKVEDNDDAPIIVGDGGDLAAALVGTVTGATVSGNVLTDPTEEAGISPANDPVGSVDAFGSDGAAATPIISLAHDGNTYTKDSAVGGPVLANDGAGTITIQTALGGTLQFNFLTGAYTYTAPLNVDQSGAADIDERFTYVIQDGDGDTDPADLVICIKDDVEPPQVTMAIGAGGQGGCVEEDSLVDDPDNQVAVHANAQGDDALTQLVITGFDNQPGWTFDFDGLKTADVDEGASDFDASDGAITIVFKPGTTSFDGTFGVQPPADTDIDLGTLTAVATAAAAGDPGETLSTGTTLDVTVDATADPVTVSLNVNDSGDAGDIFQQGETGTVQVTASFGDFIDDSETHSVLVEVPDGFTLGALDGLPAGVTAEIVDDNDVMFTVAPGTGGFDYTFSVTNDGNGSGTATFTATATAYENPNDVECDSSEDDNIAKAVATEDEQTEDGAPVIDPEDATVEEDDLPGGIDENPGITDVAANVSLGLDFGPGGTGDVTFAPELDGHVSGQTSGGASIVYQLSPDGHTLTGVAGGETVFTVTLDPVAGTYSFDLERPLDHNGDGDEESIPLSFDVIATDADGDPATASFTVNILNDVPQAEDDDTDTAADEAFNIVIVFDRSGSMDENPNVEGFSTRIDLARAAVAALLATCDSFATVNVMVVDFSSGAASTQWMSIAEANAYLATLEAGGTTNYAAAINETMDNFDSPGNPLPAADQSLVYFISDGKPNPSATSLNAGQVAAWEEFLVENDVERAFAIGVGNGIPANDPDLEKIAFNDANGDGVDDGASAIVVTDDLLIDTLVSSVVNVVSGNVLTAGGFGGDGQGSIASLAVDGDLYEFDGVNITKNGGGFPAGLGTSILVVTSLLGGVLTFDFANGDYEYTVPNTNDDETFTYTVVDSDGDSSSANLTFLNTANSIQQPGQAFGDNGSDTLAGTAGVDIMGGDDGNDSIDGGDGDDHISGGAGADTILGGAGNDILVGGSQSEVQDQPGNVRAADLGDLIDGDDGDDVILGNEGSDTIVGGAGNDTIFGGSGDDAITGGAGDDVIDLGSGTDVVHYTSVFDGHDVINNFDSNNTGGTDQLNLDALFDSLGTATADRAGRVQIDDSAVNVAEVRVDTNGDGTFDLHVATLNTVTDSPVAVGTEIIVGTGP